MKRQFSTAVLFVLLFQGIYPVFAATPGTPEYEKLKEYKKSQRERKANPSPNAKGFWRREAERSGFAGTAAMFGNAVTGVIPLEKPNSRKEAK